MTLCEEPGSSRTLVRSRHCCGDLLAYFLSPRTTWELRFEDVVIQVLKENRRHAKAVTSLTNCNRRRTDLRKEFDATSEAMQMVTDRASGVELEHRLNSLQTSLAAIERAITKYENILEDCRMQEEEARQEEAISQEQEEEEGDADVEMMEELMEEEERENGEPSGPQGVAETEEVPPLVSAGDAISPEEDAFLMQQASQPVDPAAGSHSPRSEAGTISGEMAELSLTSPGQPGPGEDETLQ